MEKYNPSEIEKKWQKKWEEEGVFTAKEKKGADKFYVLDMFPYPSSNGLHVGHPLGYIATDIVSRKARMQGKQVLHPMGWDAFGLPAENYAIKTGVHPAETTKKAIVRYREQLKMLGFSYDWDREVNTSSPEYYKWTQWLFLQLYKKGLAYQGEAPVNWCEHDQTVLANEQVVDGKCERCKNPVVQKNLKQWFFKTTAYADRLIDGLGKLDWPERIKEMQKNWIGKSEGADVDFKISGKYHFVLLHGYKGSVETDFFPWLIKELESQGHTVQALSLPNPTSPKEEESVSYVLEHATLDEKTIIVGHSLGAVVAMKVIEKIKNPIAGLVMAGGFFSPEFKDKPRPFAESFIWKFDFEAIQQKCGFINVVHDTNDHIIPDEQAQMLAKKLNATLVTEPAKGVHFNADEEPVILRAAIPSIKVFTTRLDTIFGVTYVVLAPEHELVQNLIRQSADRVSNYKEVQKYIERSQGKTELERKAEDKEKTGVELKGVKAINPANGEEVPVWVADYVLASYGTGAVMAVPAHDERDWEFAKKYKLPILEVVRQIYGGGASGVRSSEAPPQAFKNAYTGSGVLVNSGEFNGTDSEQAKQALVKKVGGKKVVQYHLRDWLVSRQRYWGVPIPIIHCDPPAGGCGANPVAEKDLPVELPNDVDFKPTGESPLVRSKKFHAGVKCPKCGKPARREADTMDTFVDSSWYFMRYSDPKNDKAFVGKKKLAYWCPVDLYVGGAEHAVMHLLYARFFTKALFDLGLVPFEEPFKSLHNQGLILGEDHQKMSKSRGNVVNPDEIVERFGADTVRVYEMFMGPFDQEKPWDTNGMVGVYRFLERVYALKEKIRNPKSEIRKELERKLHQTIKKVTEDIENFRFNTAVSAMMILCNEMMDADAVSQDAYEKFLLILSPLAPHITEELWSQLGNKKLIAKEKWPAYNPKLIIEDQVQIVVQVNGKVRDTITTSKDISENDAKEKALALENVIKFTQGKTIRKIIFVPGRLVNIVVSE